MGAFGTGGVGMDKVVLARALHVLAVVIWIGGAAMARSVILPAIREPRLDPSRNSPLAWTAEPRLSSSAFADTTLFRF
jgi:hypothetical protein